MSDRPAERVNRDKSKAESAIIVLVAFPAMILTAIFGISSAIGISLLVMSILFGDFVTAAENGRILIRHMPVAAGSVAVLWYLDQCGYFDEPSDDNLGD